MNTKSNRIPAIITATLESSTLPGRSLLMLNGKTIIGTIVEKLKINDLFDKIILCTSNKKADDELVRHAQDLEIHVIRGDYANIGHRLIKAYAKFNIQEALIVRGDCPLFDLEYCIKLFDLYVTEKAEYAYSEHLNGLPYGTGTEIISSIALDKISEIKLPEIYDEKFSAFIKIHKKLFKTVKLDFIVSKPDFRFVIENSQDYEFIKALLSLTNSSPTAKDCVEIVCKHPYLKLINKPNNGVKEIGLNKILLFPEKIKNISREYDNSFPISVELSLTNNCNLNCKWCSDNALRKNQPGSLPLSSYKKLVNDLSSNGTKGLVIEGGGEPTIYPHFLKALTYAIDSGLSVGLITNGVEFKYSDILNKLEWVRVSLDADSPENFNHWKGADKFYQVLNNIKTMCDHKGNCVLGVGYVVTKHNIKNLEEIVILLADYGVDYIYLRPVIDNPDLKIEENLFYLEKYVTGSFSVMIHAMQENNIRGNSGVPCCSHSLSSVIAGDGSVYICGRLNIHEWIKPIGNINDESFYDIWHGRERRQQIEMLKEAEFCKEHCPECRLTKYNILLNNAGKIKTRNFI